MRDWYWRAEAGFAYRPLRTVTEFAVRIGVIRGKSPVPLEESSAASSGASRLDVGLNYAEPSVLFRVADNLHFEGSFLTSVTEVGFSVGGGAAIHLGDPYGTKLVVGGETIQVFGSRFYSRLDLYPTRRLSVSPAVEVTNMPHADRAGLRLLGAAGYDLGQGFAVSILGGYQARKFTSGGPSVGFRAAYAF